MRRPPSARNRPCRPGLGLDALEDRTLPTTLSLTVANSSLIENGPATTATLTRAGDLSVALSVAVATSDATEAVAPAAVTIPAGQAAATFAVTPVDDTEADGAQPVRVTATAADLTATADLTVADDEPAPPTLAVTIDRPAVLEQAGAAAAVGTVTRYNVPLDTALVVKLTSSDTTEATVPTTVTIPAGQAAVTFAVTAVDDTAVDGPQVVTVTAQATAPTASGPLAADTGWGSGGWVSGAVRGRTAVQPDGKLLAVGTWGTVGASADFYLRRYTAAGTLDTTFGSSGTVQLNVLGPSDQPEAVLVQPDGKILVAGSATTATTQPGTMVVVRLLANGTLDATFGSGGIARLNFGGTAAAVTDAALTADGKVVLAGTVGGSFAVVRLLANGSFDATFDGDGVVTVSGAGPRAAAVAVQPDGKVVAVGHTNEGTAAQRFVVVRMTADGSADATFNGTGRAEGTLPYAYQAVSDAVVQADGAVVLAAAVRATASAANTDFVAVRYTAAGALDVGFGTGGVVYEAAAASVPSPVRLSVQPDGRIIVAGTTGVVSNSRSRILRLSPAGAVESRVDSTWPTSSPQGLALDASGNVYVAYNYGSGGTSGYVDRFKTVYGAVPVGLPGTAGLSVRDNDPFAAAADAYTTAEDTPLVVGAAAGVRANDTVTAGLDVTAEVISVPSTGTVTLAADGSFVYTPRPRFFGTDTFTYRLRDGTAATSTATVRIVVPKINDAPTAADDAYAVDEDGTLAPAAAVGATSLSMVSDAGDYIGQGRTYTLSPATGRFAATDYPYSVRINYQSLTNTSDDWSLSFRSPYENLPLAVGTYRNAVRAAFRPLGTPGLEVSGQGRGSNTLSGQFTVLQFERNAAGQITRFAADFEQHSEGRTPALRGSVRYNYVPGGSGVLSNDADADGDPLTAVLVSGPSHGQLTLNPNGTFTYTPTANYSGPDSFTYRATDGELFSPVATVNLTVRPVADPPPVSGDDATTTAEDTPAVVDVLANDADPHGLPLTPAILSQPRNGTATVNAAGRVVYTPRADFSGTDTFTYRASNGDGAGNTATVTVIVTPVPDPPAAVADSHDLAQGSTRTVAAPGVLGNDTDPDGDSLTAALVAGPANGALTLNPDGSFAYTPAPTFFGTDTFTYAAADGTGRTAPAVVRLTVVRTNLPPVGTDDTAAVDEDQPVAVYVLDNDTDPDGDLLQPIGVTQPAHGTVVANPNARFLLYTPAANFFGTDTFTYRAYDGRLYSSPVTVTVTVNPVNDAPVGGPDAVSISEDYPRNITAAALLANDTDPDQDALSVGSYTRPAHGTLAPGVGFVGLVYRPDPNFNGTDTFTYRPSDGRLLGDAVTVTITVNPVNDAPVGVDDAYEVAEDGTLTVPAAAGVLANDTDAEGDPLSAWVIRQPTNGTLTFSADGGFTYTPRADYAGVDTFYYRVQDRGQQIGFATATIAVTQVNDAPGAVPDAYTVAEDATLTVVPGGPVLDQQSLANEHPFDVGTATGEAQQGVTAGVAGVLTSVDLFVVGGSGSFDVFVNTGRPWQTDAAAFVRRLTVTPDMAGRWVTVDVSAANIGLAAGDEFVIGTRNGSGVSATLGGSVERAASAYTGGQLWYNGRTYPELASASISYDLMFRTHMQTPGGVLANDPDPDSPVLTAVLVAGPAHGTLALAADGGFTYTPHPDYHGPDAFTYRANDGAADSPPVAVTLTVTAVNDAPAGAADAYTVVGGGVLTVPAAGVLANDADVDGDPLAAVLVTGPANGTLALAADGGFTYIPRANFSGTDTFTYRPSDGQLAGEPVTVTITVAAGNAPPTAAGDVAMVAEDGTTEIPVLANDADPDGDPLTVVGVGQPANGTAVVTAAGVRYTPAADFVGTDTFTYTVSDSRGGTAVGTVTVTVTPVNDAPSFTPGGDLTVVAGSGPKAVPGWATAISRGPADEAGQGLTFLVSTTNPGLFVVPPAIDPTTGTLTFIPDASATGTAVVTVALRDSGGGDDTSAARTFTVTVTANGLPTAVGVRRVGTDLIVTGSDSADTVTVGFQGTQVKVEATLAGRRYVYYFPGVSRVVVDAKGGDDTITFAGLTLPTWTDAGDGNDTVTGGGGADAIYLGAGDDAADGGAGDDFLAGGAGKDVLQGGAGSDTVYGGDGDDLVVGGPQVDRLYGQGGNDILIGGTAVVRNPAADSLRKVLTDWDPLRPGVYADLRQRLQTGDTGAGDRLTGGTGTDWFWAVLPPDAVDDLEPGEIV